jgi:hypothetical protein
LAALDSGATDDVEEQDMTPKFGLTGLTGKVAAMAAGGAICAIIGATGAVAVGQVTSAGIKDGTIQTRDLTKNNFARFTSTESVVTGVTPASTVAAYSGAHVVDVPAGTTPTTLTSITLNKGTWKISGVAQFWHLPPSPAPTGTDYGLVTVNGLANGFTTNYTSDVPDGGSNAAQVSFSGTVTVTADNTPVVVGGQFTGGNTGQAGASITATQYVYVKRPHA